jgi:Transposase IS4
VKRWDKKISQYIEIPQPELVQKYNKSMGGVDKLDQFISYYRIFIKSRKWILRIIFHFLDFAITASWIEYRKDCTSNKTDSQQCLDLLHFRLNIFEFLTFVQDTPRKRGRPASLDSEIQENPSTKKKNEIHPIKEIRLDRFDHWPCLDSKKKNSTRCKYKNCQAKTINYCEKCKVHLCHTKKIITSKTFICHSVK